MIIFDKTSHSLYVELRLTGDLLTVHLEGLAMLQYVRINYFRSRNVYIDGALNGKTNVILRVDEGTHTFDLGPNLNYTPASIKKKVTGTSALRPIELNFELADAG